MVFVLINRSGERIKKLDGEITPAFQYASQAITYAENRLMKYYTVYNTKRGTNNVEREEENNFLDDHRLSTPHTNNSSFPTKKTGGGVK